MDEPVKKKRRLLIVDVTEDGQPLNQPPAQPVAPQPVVTITTPGHIHTRVQHAVLKLCKEARFDEEKIDAHVWNKVDEVLKAATNEEAEQRAKKALDVATIYFLLNTKKPEKQAKAAERIAKMYRNKGDDMNADKQLAKAKKIRAEMAAEEKKP